MNSVVDTANKEVERLARILASAPDSVIDVKPEWMEASCFLWWLAKLEIWRSAVAAHVWNDADAYDVIQQALERSRKVGENRRSWIERLLNAERASLIRPSDASGDIGDPSVNLFGIVSGVIGAWAANNGADGSNMNPDIDWDAGPMTPDEAATLDPGYPLGNPNDYPVNNNDPDLPDFEGPGEDDGDHFDFFSDVNLPDDIKQMGASELLKALFRICEQKESLDLTNQDQWVLDSQTLFVMTQCCVWRFYARRRLRRDPEQEVEASATMRAVMGDVDNFLAARHHVVARLANLAH